MRLCTKYNRVVLAERVTTACDLQSTTSLYLDKAETGRDGSRLGRQGRDARQGKGKGGEASGDRGGAKQRYLVRVRSRETDEGPN